MGNALNDEWVNPGYMNHDISVFKNITLGGARRLQFRFEMYNAFNATQFGEVDNDARFDFATGAQLNPNFGRVIATRVGSARVIQFGLRFLF